MNKEELESFKSSLLKLNKSEYPIRDLKIANVIYPLIDRVLDDHPIRHKILYPEDYLEFNIKVPKYFCNVYEQIEEICEYPIPESVEEYVWGYLNDELSFFMEEIDPDRDYFQEGRSGGWLIVEHYFNWNEGEWDSLSDEEKKEHLYYNNITIENFIDDIDELIFWMEFEEDLEQKKKEIEDKEFADYVIENMKNNLSLLKSNT